MKTKMNLLKRGEVRGRKLEAEILDTQAAEIKSNYIDEVTGSFTKSQVEIEEKKEEIKTYVQDNELCLIETDQWGITSKRSVPILSAVEITRYLVSAFSFYFMGVLLLAIDTFFASMIIPFILPVNSDVVQLLLGFAVAVVVIVCCEIGAGNLSSYYEGRQLLKRGLLAPIEESRVQNKLRVAIILLTVGFLLTICIAMVRYVYLETVPVNSGALGSTLTVLNDKLARGSRYASAATFVLAFLVIIMFSWLSVARKKYADKYKVHRKHSRNDRKISKRVAAIAVIADKFRGIEKDKIESAWSVMLHVFKLVGKKVDPENKAMAEKFYEEKQQPGFVISDDIYNKYGKVTYIDRALFIYGIEESPELRRMRDAMEKIQEEIAPLIRDYRSRHHFDSRESLAQPHGKMGLANVLLLITLGLALAGCNPKQPGINLVAFVDLSGSVHPEVRAHYAEIIRGAINKLTPGSTMKVLPLDAATENHSEEIIDISVPPASSFENRFDAPAQKKELEKIRFDKFKDSVLNTADKSLAEITAGGKFKTDNKSTDVLGAFRLLNQYIVTGDPAVKNMALLLSDMLSSDSELDLEHRNYTGAETDRLIGRIAKQDLSHWHIAILTGMTPASPERYRTAKEFWIKYLRLCGDKDVIYESGANSLVFAEMDNLTAAETGSKTLN